MSQILMLVVSASLLAASYSFTLGPAIVWNEEILPYHNQEPQPNFVIWVDEEEQVSAEEDALEQAYHEGWDAFRWHFFQTGNIDLEKPTNLAAASDDRSMTKLLGELDCRDQIKELLQTRSVKELRNELGYSRRQYAIPLAIFGLGALITIPFMGLRRNRIKRKLDSPGSVIKNLPDAPVG